MTEIVKNNSSMTFDLLETGSGGANSPKAKGVFNALFGGMGAERNAEMRNAETHSDENYDAEIDIISIANMLTESDLTLSNDILEEIKIRLKKLFEQIKELQSQRAKDDSAHQSGYFLKSQNWYSQKLIEELNQSETKQKFIEKELAELQKNIAIEHRNMKRAENKADEKRKKETSLLQTKKELMTPKINKL